MSNKVITLELDNDAQELLQVEELEFHVTLTLYNDCINTLQPNNKVAPMHNFLVRSSANDATKNAVNKAREQALTSDIFGLVIDEFKPKVEFTVKK